MDNKAYTLWRALYTFKTDFKSPVSFQSVEECWETN